MDDPRGLIRLPAAEFAERMRENYRRQFGDRHTAYVDGNMVALGPVKAGDLIYMDDGRRGVALHASAASEQPQPIMVK